MNINKVMHRSCGLFLIPFILTGCVSIHEETGTYLSVQSSSETEIVNRVVSDVVDFLSWKFTPSKTQFDFQYHNTDKFGISLREQLRIKGFSVSEKTGTGTKFNYFIDDNEAFVRVVLQISDALYSKTYTVNSTDESKWSVRTGTRDL